MEKKLDVDKNMKNLMIYINSAKAFGKDIWGVEGEALVKVQIDNSLRLGWKREEMMLITNFAYEYNKVQAMILEDDNYCSFSPTATKINAILDLFKLGFIKKDELYWFHDFDAFQLQKITESEIEQELMGKDLGLTEYGRTTMNRGRDKRPSTGSVFFKKSSKDIFKWIKIKIYQYKCNEEIGLLELTKIPKYRINERMKRMSITYNFASRKRNISFNYKHVEKPLRVVHFHPSDKRKIEAGKNNMDVFVYGKSKIGRPLITEELKKIFKRHGILEI